MRKTLAVFVAALALMPAALLLVPSEAAACSCMMPKDPVTSARDVDVVFEGKLLGIESPAPKGPHDFPTKVFTFEVVRTFKGQLDAQVKVVTADNSAACGRDYGKPGDAWLIYARIDDQGQLNDNLCSRTRDMAHAAEDIEQLEANKDSLDEPNPEEPVPTEPGPADPEPTPFEPSSERDVHAPEPAQPGKKGCSIGDANEGGVATLGLLGLLGLLPWSRRRAAR